MFATNRTLNLNYFQGNNYSNIEEIKNYSN